MSIPTMLLAACILAVNLLSCSGMQTAWTNWGGNVFNWRFSDHQCITNDRLAGLSTAKPLWKLKTTGTVVATPAVCGNHVYYVDWGSQIVKLTLDGKRVWEVNARSLLPGEQSVGVRTTPAFSEGCQVLYVSTQWSKGSYLLAINANTGKLQYAPVRLHPNPSSRATSSATYYRGAIYQGVSSNQEKGGGQAACCDFRGSLVKVDAATGKVLWSAYTVPEGYAGGSVWGSSPAIDDVRNQVCTGTANLYKVPPAVLACLKSKPDGSPEQRACVPKNVFVDSLVCFDTTSGRPKIGYRVHGIDIWGNMKPGAPDIETMFNNSKYVSASDYGFGQAPIILKGGNRNADLLLATSKGARSLALNLSTGQVLWSKSLSGAGKWANAYSMFGSCTNGKLFCSGLFWYSQRQGLVTCMDARSGKTLWTWRTSDGGVYGPLTCTQRHIFVPLFDMQGTLAVLDINTGRLLGRFRSGTTLFCGPAIVNGVMYMGTGYQSNGGMPSNYFMAVRVC